MNRQLLKKLIMILIGNLFIGIAVSLLRLSTLGTDPFTTINLGLSNFFNLSFGVYQLLFNFLLLIIVGLFYRSSIGIGTIINMVSIGFVSDFFVYSYHLFFENIELLVVRIIMMLSAVFFASSGVALYITPKLGMAPYDALAFVIEKVTHNKIPFAIARIATDITCVIVGFSFGAIVGIATVIFAFFTGPMVQFFRIKVAEPILKAKNEEKLTPIPAHK
ncbi:YczE/YyaS/YitT family protein [Gracilibacillus kekensis]|uniref:Uncharacterized membrane protein YczE n=1 Tax=Gracilibacillus kekensis TaxID=1027249 RepID=A0A1M7KKT5_9BACI|nr:membrane protein [Gracilibacillus kekensis]SHM65984.1 Uncharacterized membrane protein YczE [Gracilibacillus kekensis]